MKFCVCACVCGLSFKLMFYFDWFLSLSIKGAKFEIAKAVAKNVIRTLTKQDYVNVICSRASHWNEVGK